MKYENMNNVEQFSFLIDAEIDNLVNNDIKNSLESREQEFLNPETLNELNPEIFLSEIDTKKEFFDLNISKLQELSLKDGLNELNNLDKSKDFSIVTINKDFISDSYKLKLLFNEYNFISFLRNFGLSKTKNEMLKLNKRISEIKKNKLLSLDSKKEKIGKLKSLKKETYYKAKERIKYLLSLSTTHKINRKGLILSKANNSTFEVANTENLKLAIEDFNTLNGFDY